MAYQKFKLSTLVEKFNIRTHILNFIPNQLENFHVSDLLLQNLSDNQFERLGSEKAKSEFIINPVLKELHKKNLDKFSYFSGYEFSVDKKLSLSGYCDFILSSVPDALTIDAPVFCLVEAKKGEIDEGYGQCGAEMVAAHIFNERQGNPQKVIYGCVTNAFTWSFLKLENNVLSIDPRSVQLSLTNPHSVLAVLQWIVDTIKPQA